ncbi:hypothetical protein ACFQMA_07240 [Halosimplex aquaticum]|uniref:DUF8052 domain-containing protein n=1 Tax=Halosimplex aquaticum TaxID=3026162 RepID=A0ABD5XWX8_9EURY|nr:hypothetical protein [Halosimplex aquaticum]
MSDGDPADGDAGTADQEVDSGRGDPDESLEPAEDDPDVPEWDDEYFDRVSDRLMYNYDLEKDVRAGDEPFALGGEMRMLNKKHFLHPSITLGEHESFEYVYARRQPAVRVPDLERLVELGHDLADERIDPSEDHFSTEFVFVLVTESIPEEVASFVGEFSQRELLNYGYYGHYEIHLVVVAPEDERIEASRGAHVEEAFRLWAPIEREEPGLFDLITRRLQL